MTFGDVSYIHRDGGPENVTSLLYANEDWAAEWSGETCFFSDASELREAVLPAPGRLLMFVASIQHVGRPPSRLFWGHRYTLAIKFGAGRAG
eukprot:1034147-Prymnesium_polylepis.1